MVSVLGIALNVKNLCLGFNPPTPGVSMIVSPSFKRLHGTSITSIIVLSISRFEPFAN